MAERGRLVIDATGRALRMPDPALRRVCEPHLAVLGAERVAAVRREIRAAAVAVIPRRSVIYALLTAVFVVLAARRPSVPGEVVTPVMGAILGGAAIAAIAAWSLYGALAHGGFVKADRLVRIRVRHGVCPACMGVLNSASSTDGRVKCPTCGAEWPADGREGIEPAPSAA
jgi:hypothetical protein